MESLACECIIIMTGRKSDCVWKYFDTKKEVGKAGCRATCLKCGKEVQGLVARLKQQHNVCAEFIDSTDDELCILNPEIQALSQRKRSVTDIRLVSQAKKQKSVMSSMTNFVVQTSTTAKAAIDLQIARNTHLPAAWYKFAAGKKLVLPQEVRWDTIADSLQCYLENWTIILKVCEEHRDTINGTIAMKVQNINIKRNAEDYLKQMKPIAVALDKVQSDSCKLSDAVEVWKALKRDMDSLMP
ncbi:hypothetical protein LOD99_10989, partial [Oopsacas minuta]